MIGVRPDLHKELIAVCDGYRESKESWIDLLRDLEKRGFRPPHLAIADGALGFWAAATEMWPQTAQQRCWVHKLANILDKIPKRVQSRAKKMLHEIMNAETKRDAVAAAKDFDNTFRDKYPKAASCLKKDLDELMAFYDFPAQHWRHIRSTNAIESSFATLRLRQRVTKGAGNRTKALTMAFKLLHMAQQRWRRINGYHRLLDVIDNKFFVDGVLIPQAA